MLAKQSEKETESHKMMAYFNIWQYESSCALLLCWIFLRICPFPSGLLVQWKLNRVYVPFTTSKQNKAKIWMKWKVDWSFCGIWWQLCELFKITFSPAWLWEQFQVSRHMKMWPLNNENNEIRLIIAVKAPDNVQVRH